MPARIKATSREWIGSWPFRSSVLSWFFRPLHTTPISPSFGKNKFSGSPSPFSGCGFSRRSTTGSGWRLPIFSTRSPSSPAGGPVVGDETNGARRWIRMGFFSYQPSELAKLSVILVLARYIGSRTVELFYPRPVFHALGHPGSSPRSHPKTAGPGFGAPPRPGLLRPDVRGRSPGLPVALVDVHPGRCFLPTDLAFPEGLPKGKAGGLHQPPDDPLGAGYNIIQSVIAIGSGGIAGRASCRAPRPSFPSSPSTYGFHFLGGGRGMGLRGMPGRPGALFLHDPEAMEISRKARDREGSLLALGIAGMFAVQIIINVGMTVGLLPVRA